VYGSGKSGMIEVISVGASGVELSPRDYVGHEGERGMKALSRCRIEG
jgi:hypothetical protein